MSPAAMQDHWLTPDQLNNLILRARDLGAAELRILLYCATAAPAGHPVNETANAIGRRLGISSSSTSRAIAHLTTSGWLQLSYRVARTRIYALGPSALTTETLTDHQDEPLASIHPLPTRGQ
ncbi:MarR family transcriptional regulator [Streptomyces vinaceus]